MDDKELSTQGNGSVPEPFTAETPPKRRRSQRSSSGPSSTEPVDDKTAAAPQPWFNFLDGGATNLEVQERFIREFNEILDRHQKVLSSYCCVGLLDSDSTIASYDLDRIYNALRETNSNRDKNVLLFLLSPGGSIEPAYQISKLCKSFSKERFVVLVPRQAKSAATLVAIGADEVHMGSLGQLGPIDPQLSGLPALGVSQALQCVASLAEKFPGSAEMFARYLRLALTVEQIGYCERISESAVQYAERLLSTKPSLAKKATTIARELVYEYKDHGFVIDIDEARQHLGSDWILRDTPESVVAEDIYKLFDQVNMMLNWVQQKRILVLGRVPDDVLILSKPRKK
jgi:hypothetical protein